MNISDIWATWDKYRNDKTVKIQKLEMIKSGNVYSKEKLLQKWDEYKVRSERPKKASTNYLLDRGKMGSESHIS